jgi:hypothetical protein
VSNQQSADGNPALQELLIELALTLLPRGMTPKMFGELSRYAFAYAAARISQHSNGKVNHSRVAALTGLSRADVKRLLQGGDSAVPAGRSTQTPIERVVNGWRADRRFTDREGNPKPLRISGPSKSFAHLARMYGGDVPHRAILDELHRIGAVRREGKNVILNMTRVRPRRHRFASLSFVLPAIIDGIRVASTAEISRAPPSMYRLTIPAKSGLEVAIMRERCVSTVTAMLNGLEESLGHLATPRPHRDQLHSFVVTVLLAENRNKESVQLPVSGDLVRARRGTKKVRQSSTVNARE